MVQPRHWAHLKSGEEPSEIHKPAGHGPHDAEAWPVNRMAAEQELTVILGSIKTGIKGTLGRSVSNPNISARRNF